MKPSAATRGGATAAALAAATVFSLAAGPAPAQPPNAAAPNLPAAYYLDEIEGQRGVVASYRGTAALRAYGAVEGSYNAAFGRVLPDRSRLEISTPLTGTALIVTAEGGRLLAYYPGDNVAVVAADRGWGLAALPAGGKYGGLAESLDWLAGRPPLYASEIAAGGVEMTAGQDEGRVTLSWRAPGGPRFQQITLAGDPLRVVNARLYENDEVTFDVTYDDWRDRGDVGVPFAITVKTADVVVEISVKKFEVDAAIPEAAFSTTPPAGATVTETWPAGQGYNAEN